MRTKAIRVTQICGLLVCFMMMVVGSSYSAIIIDNFDDSSGALPIIDVQPVDGSAVTHTTSPTPNALGNKRDESAELLATDGTGNVSIQSGGGVLTYAQSNLDRGMGGVVWYEGEFDVGNGVDLTADGDPGIFLRLISIDQGVGPPNTVNFIFTITDKDGGLTDSVTRNQGPTSGAVLFFPFTEFNDVTLTEVTKIELEIKPEGTDTDLTMDLITTNIPEPGTLILLGSGLLGLAGYVRRRKKKA